MTDEQKARRDKMRSLAKIIAGMSAEAKAELSAKLPAICTIDGHTISRHNMMMLYYQGIKNPTIVGGFNQWKRNGRSVRKGQHGFSIWIPCSKGQREDSESTDGAQGTYFILGTMFDLSQTCKIGEEIPELAPAA